MKMPDGLHSLTFNDPPEEMTATVSDNGNHCIVEPGGIVLLWNEEEGRYEGAEGFPRFYPSSDGFFVWWVPGMARTGHWI